MRWTLLVPVRAQSNPKSRLAATLPEPSSAVHAALVEAMRTDVLTAARATPQVARIVVITDGADSYPVDLTLRQRSPGLNGALRDGAEYALRSWPEDGIAALVGDVPAVRPDELGEALDVAATHRRAFVPDAEGTGTTLLAAAPGEPLRPEFGLGSADRHARQAARLEAAGPGLRADVDTVADLGRVIRLGAGVATSKVLGDIPRSSWRAMMSG